MKPSRILLIAAAAIIPVAAWMATVRVPEGSVAVIDAAGQPPRALAPGTHVVMPGSRLAHYTTEPVTASGEILVTPQSGGEVPMRYTAAGRIDPARAGEMHRLLAAAPVENFLSSQTATLLTRATSGIDPVELLTPAFRTKAGEAIAATLGQAGILDARVTVKPPDDVTLLAAAQHLIQTREAWKIRMTVAEALLEPARARSWRLLTAMGLVNESERLYKEAETNYLDALAVDPAAVPPMSQLVAIYSAVGELQKLRRILDAALAAQPGSLQHLNWAAMVLMKLNESEAAEKLLNEAAAIDPDNATIKANLAGLMLKQERAGEAIELLKTIVAAAPDNGQALFNLGSALASTGRYREALPWLEQAEAVSPMSPPLARTLMRVHEELGDAGRSRAYRDRLRAMETEEAARRKARGTGGAPGQAPRGPS